MSLLFKAEWHPIGCIDFVFLIHLSVEGQSGCFHILAIVTNATHYKHAQISLQDPTFNNLGYKLRSGMAGSYDFMTNLDSIFKCRDITLPNKVRLVKAMVFPVVMYGCERRLSAEELMLLNCSVGEDS